MKNMMRGAYFRKVLCSFKICQIYQSQCVVAIPNLQCCSTVIWCNSIGYGFITLEPKNLIIAKALSILFISIERWHDKMSSFSKFVATSPCCRTKKDQQFGLFDVIQIILCWHSGILVDIVFPILGSWGPKYHCLEKVYRHSEFRLRT